MDIPKSGVDGKVVTDGNRVSVFTRLSPKTSFADVVGDSVKKGLDFFPLENKLEKRITIPIELARAAAKDYSTTIVGYFLGSRVPFPIVQRCLRSAWGKLGFNDVMMNAHGFFFIKFNDEGGSNSAIEEGMVMIRDVPLFVCPWDPSKGLTRPSHDSCPLWVKFHNIPLVLFNNEGISRIASAIGVPKRMDACTATMCDKKWGRPGFAKVLIDVWATGELKKDLEVVIPHLHDEGMDKVKIEVEYLWEPNQCTHCSVFGHKRSSCPKAVRAVEKKKQVHVDDEGFIRVERKQWRRKDIVGAMDASSSGTKSDEPIVQHVGDMVDSGVPNKVVEGLVEPQLEVLDKDSSVEPIVAADVPVSPVREKEFVSKAASSDVQRPMESEVPQPALVDPTSPLGSLPVVPPPKAPIKGILKNTSRFGDQRKEGKDGREDSVANKKLSLDKGGCWNIRGLNAPEKQQEVRAFIRNNNIGVCAVLESHVRQDALPIICDRVFGRWSWLSNHAFSNGGTRIIVGWDVNIMDVMLMEAHSQYIHCQVNIRGGCSFFVSFVYGANRATERMELWSGLRRLKVCLGDKPWVILGDFNSLLFPHDALGGVSRRNPDMMDFFLCLEDIEVFDVRFSGIHYTWCQKPKEEAGLRRKLDRILANTEFTSLCSDATASFLPRGLSDHSPGILSFTDGSRKRKYGFRFDNFLVKDPKFVEIVKQSWNGHVHGSFMFSLVTRLKALKQPFRKLRGSYGNLSDRVRVLKHELDVVQLAADLDPSNAVLQEDLAHLRVAYQHACWVELRAAKQRAKVRWLEDGDANTKYFHHVVREKRHVNHIQAVSNVDGNFVYDDTVPKAFIDYFKSIIGTSDDVIQPFMEEDLFSTKLSMQEALFMIRPITDEDIKDAMFSIGSDKAPGPDGFSSKFFKAAWEVVGNDVMTAVHNFFYRGLLLRELNHTLLCLLPKVANASMVSDYRPIACCSVLYKCIAKIIVERVKPSLDRLISRAQSAFIPGRRIVDNILMAHELVSGYHLNKGPPRCAFKIDLRKAYDMVNWDFLFTMLKGCGLHEVIIRWIKEMVTTPSYSIAINGESWGHFKGARGIRQGDPMSPYLFTFVMEGFSMILKMCIEEANEFGFHHGCADIQISHLCFADDLFVFTRGDVASVEVLKKALSIFANRSGLSPNLNKSDVFFGNVPSDIKNAILNCLPFRLGAFPIRYLGVPLSPSRLKASDFGNLVSKVKMKLHNWKAKFLSFGGRKQLIISVLQSMQLYWMAVFVFPSCIIHELEACFRDFLWSQGEQAKGRCKVAWHLLCKPKEAGGLGFRKLTTWNRALIAKQLWDIVANRNTLWVMWIKRNILRDSHFWTARKRSYWSWTFAKMMNLRTEIRRFVSVRIGNGLNTNAWEDKWCSCGPLSAFVPYRFIHAQSFQPNSNVRTIIETFQGAWPNDWLMRYPVLYTDPLPLVDDALEDSVVWDTNNGDGTFSVKRAYDSLVGDHPLVTWSKVVWFSGHIPKHAFCLWLACLNRLPTQDRIREWKHNPPDMRCSLCKSCEDSLSHLFFECPFATQVWSDVLAKVQWTSFPTSWNDIKLALESSDRAPKIFEHKLALAACVYMIWIERNQRLFTTNARSPIQIVTSIVEIIQLRVAWRMRKRGMRNNHVDTVRLV
ncbi:hypothetical protein OSB04_un000116 [Centaurea solstitialis]|uniref:Reverse transcriptase domain-containing protein n=1 Tax=Centaurea solstitialis TaxID=347529 RepID=A0AA38SIR4_9ASTR|nr:hypothetical protein OSB04_un000116 [Centaurea solstitialis]